MVLIQWIVDNYTWMVPAALIIAHFANYYFESERQMEYTKERVRERMFGITKKLYTGAILPGSTSNAPPLLRLSPRQPITPHIDIKNTVTSSASHELDAVDKTAYNDIEIM